MECSPRTCLQFIGITNLLVIIQKDLVTFGEPPLAYLCGVLPRTKQCTRFHVQSSKVMLLTVIM